MSAWLVSKTHIDAMVTAALSTDHQPFSWYHEGERHELDYTTADEVGSMLWAECARSVSYRYPDIAETGDWPRPADFTEQQVFDYRFQRLAGFTSAHIVQVLKAVSCYEYQSCEHPQWEASSAHALCQELKDRLVSQLPGYSAAPWGFDDPRQFQHA